MSPHISLDSLTQTFPTGGLRRIRSHFQQIIQGDYEHSVIIYIDSWIRQIIHITSEIVIRLYIAPISGHCSIKQSIFLIISFPHQIIYHSVHSLENGLPGNFLIQYLPITRLTNVFTYDLNQGRFLVRLYRILKSDMFRGGIRIIRRIIIPCKIFFQHITIDHLIIRLLKSEKQ